MKSIKIKYDGEFSSELQLVIPFAYYCFKNNLLEETVSSKDTKCLYYFSDKHKEKYNKRRYYKLSLSEEPAEKIIPNKTEHTYILNTSQWQPPPYKEVYKNKKFIWEKEPLVISNKFCIEWDKKPYNYLDIDTLHEIINLLKDRYQLIYNRPLQSDIVTDDDTILDLKDFELLDKYPEVITMQKLHKENRGLSFCALELMVFANCNKFISVQGGISVLSSYFGGTNIIYIVRGKELKYRDHEHFFLFSKVRVITCRNSKDLLASIKNIYCNKNRRLYCAKEQLYVKICALIYYVTAFLKTIINKLKTKKNWVAGIFSRYR